MERAEGGDRAGERLREWTGSRIMSFAVTERSAPSDAERGQVDSALSPNVVAGHLREAFPSPDSVRETCRIVDAKYEPGVQCKILYQLGERFVLGILRWSADDGSRLDGGRRIDPLGMDAFAFPDDPWIPGLARAFEPGAMERIVVEALPELASGTARLLRTRTTLVRYRPGRRCTVLVHAWLRDATSGEISARTLYGKLYHDAAKAASVFEEMRNLHDNASLRASGYLVARPVAWLPSLRLLFQEPLVGRPLESLLLGRAAHAGDRSHAVRRVAEALAALHESGLSTDRVRPVARSLERMGGWARGVEAIAPALGREMIDVADALGEAVPQEGGPDHWSLVHGDCKPSQFLIEPRSVSLLDFDHCGMADPISDVGNFLASLRQLAVRHELRPRSLRSAPDRSGWMRDLERSFLGAYFAARGIPPTVGRARWYGAAALLRKSYRGFQRSGRSPLPHAMVREAGKFLEERWP
jgi:thiamine kinase-like enzyme